MRRDWCAAYNVTIDVKLQEKRRNQNTHRSFVCNRMRKGNLTLYVHNQGLVKPHSNVTIWKPHNPMALPEKLIGMERFYGTQKNDTKPTENKRGNVQDKRTNHWIASYKLLFRRHFFRCRFNRISIRSLYILDSIVCILFHIIFHTRSRGNIEWCSVDHRIVFCLIFVYSVRLCVLLFHATTKMVAKCEWFLCFEVQHIW